MSLKIQILALIFADSWGLFEQGQLVMLGIGKMIKLGENNGYVDNGEWE